MLRIVFRNRQRNIPKAEGIGSGPQGRINKMRKLVTALVRHERIEGIHHYLDESRGYVELVVYRIERSNIGVRQLVQEAQKHGDRHKPTMDLADYWLLEKDLIHKLFKVLAPRYKDNTTGITKLHNLPLAYPGKGLKHGVLELKGNPWPPVIPHVQDLSGTLVNVLLQKAKKDFYHRKDVAGTADSVKSSREHLEELSLKQTEIETETLPLDEKK